jgi:two-component system chemotaxis sensor kinase CheA
VSEHDLPKQLIARFRAVSLERIERVGAAWLALTQRMGNDEVEAELLQDVHTLKGEARVVGFADVVLITQRLEDVLFAARRHKYRVHEEVDVVFTMGLQFILMLVRKKAGTSQGGIDMNGFLKHIDEVMAEWPRHSEMPSGERPSTSAPSGDGGRLAQQTRLRLGLAATEVYLSSIAAPSDARLRRAWTMLAGELAELGAVPILPLVRRHAAAAKDLAAELGREIDVAIVCSDIRVGVEVLDALNAALLHTLRNAVDHGIESPEDRRSRGKPRRGAVEVHIASSDDAIEVAIRDDGAGVDVERLRKQAVTAGVVSAEEAAAMPVPKLIELVFVPGVTVRESASPISGRGIGLDAVRASVERVRGAIQIASQDGAGVTVTIRFPPVGKVVEVHRLPSTRPDVFLALPTTWKLRAADGATAVDPLDALAVGRGDVPRIRYLVTRDSEEHALWAGGPAARSSAVRICPTAPTLPVEVVEIDSTEAIFVRPDVLFRTA